MNAKVKVLRNVLQSVIDDIDNDKYDRTDAEIDAAIEVVSLLNVGIKRYSKRYLCDNVYIVVKVVLIIILLLVLFLLEKRLELVLLRNGGLYWICGSHWNIGSVKSHK